MKKRVFLVNILLILSACLFFVGMVTVGNPNTAYALEQEHSEIVPLSTGNNRSDNKILISGTTQSNEFITAPINDFTGVKYIPNANYFLINPKHHENDTSDNGAGTCTTVAMQMLLGYHNYYSDRRIIPTTGNGRTFLNEDYGNIEGHPAFERATMPVSGSNGTGCKQIGTENGVYEELFDLTWISSWYGIGQALGLVKDGAVRFVTNHTPQAARNGMSITSGLFGNGDTARSDIDAGRPIILGMNGFLGDSQDSFHFVVAYGYAAIDNVDGFLVHYGWGDDATQVWVPASWFGTQIRMSVKHVHTFIDTGIIVKNTHRQLDCADCGYRTPDQLYNITESTITGNKYQLYGDVTVPDSINIYHQDKASFEMQTIAGIGPSSFSDQIQLTQISIPDSVSQIGDSAFEGCINLNSITFGWNSKLYNVGNNAFANCASLTDLKLPTSITNIGDKAFENCTSLESVALSANVTTIGYGAFANCTSLTGLKLPISITSIGDNAFENCTSLTEIALSIGVDSIGNSLFRGCSSLASISMPYGVESIGDFAFANCGKLSRVVFPKGSQLTSIGDYAFQGCVELASVPLINCSLLDYIGIKAFQGCHDLTEIVIPDRVTRINAYTFQMSGLTKVELSNKSDLSSVGDGAFNQTEITYMIIPSGLEEIGTYAFSACDSLTTVYYGGESETKWGNINIGANNTKLTNAQRYYFCNGQPTVYGYFWHYVDNSPQVWPFYGLKYTLINNGKEYEVSKADYINGVLDIPSSHNGKPVTRIARWGFANSSDITGIIIPESINMLYGNSFAYCPNIESITVDSANTMYMDGHGKNCIITRKTQILVVGCKNSVLPEGLGQIGSYAFAGCSDLTNITIPSNVVTIGYSAFEDCIGLTSFIMQRRLQTIGDNALRYCSGITDISIPDSVTSIGDNAFYGLGFTSVTVPSSVSSIGQNAFGGNYLTAINVDVANAYYYSDSGILFSAEGVLLSCPSRKSGTYDIPDGTTAIGDYAFYGCWELEGVTILSNVTSIGEHAFSGCTQLAYITIPDDSGLESIGPSAFLECCGVSEIKIPQGVTFIGAIAFGDWGEEQTIVMKVDFSFSDQWDVDWALQCYAQIYWRGNFAIATEGLEYSLTDRGYEVSAGSCLCDNKKTVVIPADYNGYPVVGVAPSGFEGYTELRKVTFMGNNLVYIGSNAFADCSKLMTINFPLGMTHIYDGAFRGCVQLQSIFLPRTIEIICPDAFSGCNNLKSITIRAVKSYIEDGAFGCIGEYTIYADDGIDTSEWHFINSCPTCVVFYNCMFDEEGMYLVSICVQGYDYINAYPTPPRRVGYEFVGWTTILDGDVEYNMEDLISGAIGLGTILYAVWVPIGG